MRCASVVASREAEHCSSLRAGMIESVEAELVAARHLNRRTEESVTWQAFQRARGRLYGAIGEDLAPGSHTASFAATRGQSPAQTTEAER